MDDGGARCHSEQPCSVVEVVSDPGSGRAAASIEPESCVNQFYESHDFSVLRRALRQADEEWMEEFLQCDGLLAVFDALSAFNGPVTELDAGGDGLLDALPQLECVECLKAVMNSPQGMEAMIRSEGGRFVHRLVLELDSENMLVKMHLFLLLSALCKHSEDGFAATLQALDNYKHIRCTRHRYSILVFELQTSEEFPEHQAAVLAFINYIVSACKSLDERTKLRSGLSALQFPDILARLRYSEDECLSEQVRLYEEGQIEDREMTTMPGGIDIHNHEHLFRALFEKIFATPHASCLLHILQNLLLVERDTPRADAVWTTLEKVVEGAITMASPQQSDRVCTAGIEKLRRALEEEEARRLGGGETEVRGGEAPSEDQGGEESLSSVPQNGVVDTPAQPQDQQVVEAEESAPPPPPAMPPGAPPPPPAPGAPPPPPPFGLGKKIMAVVLSMFDKARQYRPKKRMKKMNWEKVPKCDAKASGALWYEATKASARLRVKVREEDLEVLFCQKSGSKTAQAKSNKTHLPNQKKALNVNIVLDAIGRPSDDIAALVKQGDISAFTLVQVNILVDQAPTDEDAAFLIQFAEDPSPLGKTEDFLLRLIKLECYPQRLKLLKTKLIFDEILEEYKPSFNQLHLAMNELMQSTSLQELFYILLLIGNIINGGSQLGDAYGFKITSLQRLSGTLANVSRPNINIIHYLVTVCEKDCPHLLQFSNSLPTLTSASRISVKLLQEEIDEWRTKVGRLRRQFESGKVMREEDEEGESHEAREEEEGVDLPEDLREQMGIFIPEAECKLLALYAELDNVKALGRTMSKYFCDDRTDFLEHVFSEMKEFRDEFRKIVKETFKEKPIELHMLSGEEPIVKSKPVKVAPPAEDTRQPSTKETGHRPGFKRAVSVVTEREIDYLSLSPLLSPQPQLDSELHQSFSIDRKHSFGRRRRQGGMRSHITDSQLLSPVNHHRSISCSMDHLEPSGELSNLRKMSWSQGHRRMQKMQSVDSRSVIDSNLSDVTKILHNMAQAIRNDMHEGHP